MRLVRLVTRGLPLCSAVRLALPEERQISYRLCLRSRRSLEMSLTTSGKASLSALQSGRAARCLRDVFGLKLANDG
jgi:hypothetical protein